MFFCVILREAKDLARASAPRDARAGAIPFSASRN
jgi:hypothetical protein